MSRQHRVLVLSAPIGEGHDLPARVLAAELEERGAEVTVRDGLPLMGRTLHALAVNASPFHSSWGNRLFDVEYWLLARWAPTRRFGGRMLHLVAAPGLLRAVAAARADIVVSTYPGFTEALGRARIAGRLGVPLVSAITDLAGLRFWAHPGVDLHLVTHPESVAEVRSIAPHTEVVPVRGLNAPEFLVPRDRREARRDLELPGDAPIVVVSGGGWAVGNLEGAVEVALAVEGAMVVVLCGRSASVRGRMGARFAGERRVRVLGFTDRMPDLLAAADALVHSTAGLTVLEALIRGCPAISYGWGRGHVRLNDAAFARFGLAEVARGRHELAGSLARALSARRLPDASLARLPSAAAEIMARFAGEPGADQLAHPA